MNRIRICGENTNRYEQIIELTNEELQQFRNNLNHAENKVEQAINDFLGEYGRDTEPIDWQYNEWSADLVDDNGSIIESLDYNNE